MALVTKYRGETFWIYPMVLNSGMAQSVRVWAAIIRPDNVAIPAIIARANMAEGESLEFNMGVLIPNDAPLAIYGTRVLIYPGEEPEYMDIFEESDVLEVVGLEKEILAVRYA